MGEALLEVRGATKRYGGLVAVNEVSFTVERGEVFGIAGPNGAGKTTLFDVVTGMVRASGGEILFEGAPIHTASIHEICHRGITRTFQKPSVFDSETVMGNVIVGAHFGTGTPWWRAFRRDRDVWHGRQHAGGAADGHGTADHARTRSQQRGRLLHGQAGERRGCDGAARDAHAADDGGGDRGPEHA